MKRFKKVKTMTKRLKTTVPKELQHLTDKHEKWAQHCNRDTGYGICINCIQWIRKDKRETEEDIKSFYGIEGINWGETKE